MLVWDDIYLYINVCVCINAWMESCEKSSLCACSYVRMSASQLSACVHSSGRKVTHTYTSQDKFKKRKVISLWQVLSHGLHTHLYLLCNKHTHGSKKKIIHTVTCTFGAIHVQNSCMKILVYVLWLLINAHTAINANKRPVRVRVAVIK